MFTERKMTMPILLLTGFEPFGGENINPSWEVVKRFSGYTLGEWRVEARQLPVAWEEVEPALTQAFDDLQPAAVIAVGQSGGRAQVALERVAINYCLGIDNKGLVRSGEAVVPTGPAAYFSTLPIDTLAQAQKSAGIPAYISLSAGAYLCNFALYSLLHLIQERSLPTPAAFIHIPYLPEQVLGSKADVPSMSLETVEAGFRVIIGEVVKMFSEKEGA